MYKVQDKDKDQTCKDKDKDKDNDLNLVPKESLRTRIHITGNEQSVHTAAGIFSCNSSSFYLFNVIVNRGFKVPVYVHVKYLKNLGTKLLLNTNKKPYEVYQVVPHSMTFLID